MNRRSKHNLGIKGFVNYAFLLYKIDSALNNNRFKSIQNESECLLK